MSAATIVIHNYSGTNVVLGAPAGAVTYILPPGRSELEPIPYGPVSLTNQMGVYTLDLEVEGDSMWTIPWVGVGAPANKFEFRASVDQAPEYLGHGATYQDLTYWGIWLAIPMLAVGLGLQIFRQVAGMGGSHLES